MSQYEKYVFFLCLIVFIVLTMVLTIFLVIMVKQSIKLIRYGEEDGVIIKEYFKERNRKHRVSSKLNIVFSIVFCLVLLGCFGGSKYLSYTETNKVNNISLKVVQSDSMSYRNEKNTYLFENNLENQFQTHDIIVIHKLPDEFDLKLFDIVVYEYESALIVHRIIRIEEPNESHPNHRLFTFQGDAVDKQDSFYVRYDQMIGIYRDKRIPFIGSFVLFMQSYAGTLCFGLLAFAMIATPIVEYRIKQEKALRMIPNIYRKKK